MSIARPALHPHWLYITPTTTADHHLFTSSLSISLCFAFYFIPLCGAEDSPIHSLFRVRPFVHKFDPGPEVAAEAAEEAAAVSAGVCIHLSTAMHQIQYKLWATNHLVLINISSCSSSNFKLCLSVRLSVAASVSVLRHHLSSN